MNQVQVLMAPNTVLSYTKAGLKIPMLLCYLVDNSSAANMNTQKVFNNTS